MSHPRAKLCTYYNFTLANTWADCNSYVGIAKVRGSNNLPDVFLRLSTKSPGGWLVLR